MVRERAREGTMRCGAVWANGERNGSVSGAHKEQQSMTNGRVGRKVHGGQTPGGGASVVLLLPDAGFPFTHLSTVGAVPQLSTHPAHTF